MSAVEPGERARALLRIADEALDARHYAKAAEVATVAHAYLAAAQLDLFERQWAEAKAADAERAAEFTEMLADQERQARGAAS